MTEPDDPILEIDLDGVTYRQLYDMVVENGEIIITIDKTAVQACKRGLTVHKSRIKQKLKEADLAPDSNVLRFEEILVPGSPELVKLHIIHGQPKTVLVHKIEIPDDTI
jgi:hypothetical protein